jgi:serine/threonine-protein kinase ATR
MVQRANEGASPWKDMFHGCRTALRSPAGLRVAEFVLPLLVLDRLCFGDSRDFGIVLNEIIEVFESSKKPPAAGSRGMSQPEHRKAVNTLFMLIDTLQHWSEAEKESRQCKEAPQRGSQMNGPGAAETWSVDDCLFNIDRILGKLPLLLQAEAAASVGMHARALRLLEMAARNSVVEQIFNVTGTKKSRGHSPKVKQGSSRALGSHVVCGGDLNLMKVVLAELKNCETMAALEEDSRHVEPRERTMDSIKQNEAAGHWEGALRDYERLRQLRDATPDIVLQLGALRCLLKLGQFESVLNQVEGIIQSDPQKGGNPPEVPSKAMLVKPIAVEAAWRLGRWEALSKLTNETRHLKTSGSMLGPDTTYQIAQGKVMLGLHERDLTSVTSALHIARQAVMDSLSSVARESYSRAYPYVVRLQCLREIEDASHFLCTARDSNPLTFVELTKSESPDGWGWQKRLELVSPASSGAVIDTRLALARLAREPVLEGSLFLTVGKRARKSGLLSIAADSLAQAEATFHCVPPGDEAKDVDSLLNTTKMQLAKLKHIAGHSSAALKMLGQDQVHHLYSMEPNDAKRLVISRERDMVGTIGGRLDDDVLIHRFCSRALLKTQWIVEGGLKDGAEIMNRFRLIHKVGPDIEKGEK